MCGFFGVAGFAGDLSELDARFDQADASLVHRGPDDGGSHIDPPTRSRLGFRRLAVRDLSRAGHQPMSSLDGRFTIVFNGEIYNADNLLHLYEQATGAPMARRGRSDTEVLLNLISIIGLDDTLRHLDGMFAIALLDREREELHLARDWFGEKPLFYREDERGLFFASELSALNEITGRRRLNEAAIIHALVYGFCPVEQTPIDGSRKLAPGQRLTYSIANRSSSTQRLWSPGRRREESTLRFESVVELVAEHLLEQVNSRLVSDVPVGLFLSSGTDSSLIDAALRVLGRDDCLRITAEITQMGYTERAASRGRSENYKTLVIEPQAIERAASKTLRLFDEPLADTAAIPLGLLADTAREHVTVVLGGDGADELFGGYNRYVAGRLARNEPVLAQALAAAGPLVASFERARGNDRAAGRLDRLSAALKSAGETSFAISFMSGRSWLPASLICEASRSLVSEIEDGICGASTAVKNLCDVDTVTFLRSQLLPKTDRVLMSRSLEGRLPFLSRKTYELARSLSDNCLVSGRQTKMVLRAVRQKLDRMTGIEAPRVARKTGFDVPVTGNLLMALQGELESAVTLVSKMFGETTARSLRVTAAKAMEHANRESPCGLSLYRAAAVGAWADQHAVGT